MEIAPRRLMEMAVHVKLASEAVLAAAHHLATLRPEDGTSQAAAWSHTMDQLVALNVQLGFMERIMRKVTHADVAASRPGRNGRGASA